MRPIFFQSLPVHHTLETVVQKNLTTLFGVRAVGTLRISPKAYATEDQRMKDVFGFVDGVPILYARRKRSVMDVACGVHRRSRGRARRLFHMNALFYTCRRHEWDRAGKCEIILSRTHDIYCGRLMMNPT